MDEQRGSSRSHGRSVGRGSGHSRSARADEVTPADIRQTIGELVRILVLRRWTFLVPLCLATTAAFIASHYVPRLYEAHTTFEQTNDPVSVELPPTLVTSSFSYFLSTLDQDIKSGEVMSPVLEEVGLLEGLPRNPDGTLTEEGVRQREAIAKSLAERVTVNAWPKSPYHTVIELTYTGPSRSIMTKLLNGMKEGYKQLVRYKVTEKLTDARDWYASQAGQQRKVFDQVDHKVTAIRIKHPGVDPANPDSIALELSSLQASLAEVRRTHSRLESQVAARKEFLSNARAMSAVGPTPGQTPAPAGPRPAVLALQRTIADSEAHIAELKIKRGMTDLHPDIVEERRLQERYRKTLAAEMGRQADLPADAAMTPERSNPQAVPWQMNMWMPAVAQVEMDLASLVEQRELTAEEIDRLKQQVAECLTLQGDVFAKRQEVGRLEEEFTRARMDYETYQGLVDKCNRALTVENENRGILFTDIVPAEEGLVPVSPLAKTIVLLSLLAGLVTGAVFVVIAELFDRRFRTSAQVTRALGLPILECVSEIVTSGQRRRGFVRRAILVPTAAALLIGMLLVSGGASYMSLNHPDSFERLMTLPRAAWAQVIQPLANTDSGPVDNEPAREMTPWDA